MNQQTCVLLFLPFLLMFQVGTVYSTSMADVPATEVDDVPNESIDEIMINAANSSREFAFFPNSDEVRVELDMVFSREEYEELQRLNNASRTKRTAGIINGRGGGRRWTNNVVPYQLARVFSGRDIAAINAAIADWEKYTCLDFQQRSSGNRMYLNNGGGCYSRVGMVGGAQTVGLAPGCRNKGIVIHEIGHALGLHHEQTRPDRDQHVRILNQNIPPRVRYNFQRNTWNVILNMGIPYDYTSIMHYGPRAFSTNGGLTIQTINPKYQNVIGNRHALSFRDIKSINIMYNCKRHDSSCTKTDADCPGEGFVGKDCTCWCPGGSLRNPTKSCTGGGGGGGGGGGTTRTPVTRPTTPQPTGCQDRNSQCSRWASIGECRANPSYMNDFCKRSCNKCGGGGGGGGGSCKDLHFRCPMWRWYCRSRTYGSFMSTNCKQTCGLCGARAEACVDRNAQCSAWAAIGECHRNPGYMTTSCRRSCRQCNAASPGGSTGRTCWDKNEHCSFWSLAGECQGNPGYMRFNCPLSCGHCSPDTNTGR